MHMLADSQPRNPSAISASVMNSESMANILALLVAISAPPSVEGLLEETSDPETISVPAVSDLGTMMLSM